MVLSFAEVQSQLCFSRALISAALTFSASLMIYPLQENLRAALCRTLPSYSDKPTPDLLNASLSPVITDEVRLSHCVLFVCRFWRFWEHRHQPVSVVSFTHIRQCSAHTFTSDDVFQAVASDVQQLEELIGGLWRQLIWSDLLLFRSVRARLNEFLTCADVLLFCSVPSVVTAQWEINTFAVDHTPHFCPLMSHLKSLNLRFDELVFIIK